MASSENIMQISGIVAQHEGCINMNKMEINLSSSNSIHYVPTSEK